MQLITRYKFAQLKQLIEPGKVVVLYGARRVGKTTLLSLAPDQLAPTDSVKVLNGDYPADREEIVRNTQSQQALQSWIGDVKTIIIDEAQSIEMIGVVLKRIVDTLPDLQVVVSGSASFELAQQVGEPLVGRKWTAMLYPLAWSEIHTRPLTMAEVEDHLLYGCYPAVVTADHYQRQAAELQEIVSGSLLKDALNLEGLRDSQKIRDLLKLIAFQVGSEVSIAELGSRLALTRRQVEQYLDIFEKSFVIFRLGGLSRNLRKEIAKSAKYYFYDTGIRNAVIGNFRRLADRDDAGQLWENAMIVERLKWHDRRETLQPAYYFWRTYDQQEIDFVEDVGGRLAAFEFKWQGLAKVPGGFRKAYPTSPYGVVNRDNYWEFIAS